MARRKRRRNAALLLLAAAIVLLPLLAPQLEGASFAGADGKAQALIESIEPAYRPWAAPLWTPPGKETESLLFALQAAVGAGVLGYCLGLSRGKRRAGAAASDDAGDERD
ncbi:MAG: energy-coupling factor ABC transporter substrate-binding protein [Rhodospirillales bacterium]|nr:energy-coupling factor ABC transporter substrate-binding protein [Rhodospirillales bacterium]